MENILKIRYYRKKWWCGCCAVVSQSVRTLPVTRIVIIVKSITAREIFAKHKELKKILWGGNLWTSGFCANTVGQFTSEDVIKKYIKNQGKDVKCTKLHEGQLNLEPWGYLVPFGRRVSLA